MNYSLTTIMEENKTSHGDDYDLDFELTVRTCSIDDPDCEACE